MSDRPSKDSPYPVRLRAYLKERFPLGSHGLLIISYYSSNQFLAHVLTHPGEPMRYSVHSLMGAVTIFCIFFHLRVFDEHKDYNEDLKHYPERILQSGIFTLKDLKILGALAIGIELMLSFVRGPAALTALLIALAFSVLMRVEFFVGGWLRKHFLVYALSHMLIMPLLALVVYGFAVGGYPWEAPAWFWLYAFVGFFVTLNWEISRKIRAPEQEIDGVDSYTKIFGKYGAAYAVLIVRVVDTGMVSLVGWHLGLPRWFYIVLIALFCVCLVGFAQYRFATSPKTAKRMEIYAGMYIVAFDIALAIAIAGMYGLDLGVLGTIGI